MSAELRLEITELFASLSSHRICLLSPLHERKTYVKAKQMFPSQRMPADTSHPATSSSGEGYFGGFMGCKYKHQPSDKQQTTAQNRVDFLSEGCSTQPISPQPQGSQGHAQLCGARHEGITLTSSSAPPHLPQCHTGVRGLGTKLLAIK